MELELIKTLYREILSQGAHFVIKNRDGRITVLFGNRPDTYLWWGEICYAELGRFLIGRIQ